CRGRVGGRSWGREPHRRRIDASYGYGARRHPGVPGAIPPMGAGPTELIARARAGQADALGELCALYRNYLRMVVRTGLGPRLRERVELSDVVQETLVEVVRQFPRFTG